MNAIGQFDNEIASLLNNKGNLYAINHAKEHITHALAALSGIYFSRFSNTETAVKFAKLALEIQPNNPVLYSNLVGYLCNNDCDLEAWEYGKLGIVMPDANADMFYNHGIACKNLGLLDQSADAFRRARDLNPECAITHCQLGNVLLALGEYEEGLREDEWRFKAHSGLKACRRRYKQPDWDGKTDLQGKKILVFNEQGHGDYIQFSRYIPKLKELGAYVILEVQSELYNLYINAPYVDKLIEREKADLLEPMPEHDFVISVGSLPYYFDPKLDQVPMSPYISPMETDISDIAALMEVRTPKMHKVGIIWAGSPWHSNDKDRSCFLRHFAPIANLPNVRLFSLQQGNMERTWPRGTTVLWQGDDRIDVVNLLEGSEGIDYVDLGADILYFNETALVMKKLDLLITVDTSVAHLAGAMGLPVWLLLPYAHEWRWRLNWYPKMKVFRQIIMGDWKELLERVAKELSLFVKND